MEKRGLVAAKELEDDVKHTLCVIFRGSDEPLHVGGLADSGNVRKRGGLLVGIPKPVAPGKLLPPEDLRYYKKAFEKVVRVCPLFLMAYFCFQSLDLPIPCCCIIFIPKTLRTVRKPQV